MLVNQVHLHARLARAFPAERLGEPLHRRGVRWGDGAGGFALDQPHRAAAAGHEKVNLQPLRVAEIV